MIRALYHAHAVQRCLALFAILSLATLLGAAETRPTEKVAANASAASDPSLDVAVRWLPQPPPGNPAAEAKNQKGMKAYTEKIPGTDVSFGMVPIPGGSLKMGSPAGEKGRNSDEGPQVKIKIEPFWMEKHEVTWNQYELWGLGLDKQRREAKQTASSSWDKLADAVAIPTKPYSDMTFGMGKDGFPAVCMTQFAAKMYCKWLSAKTGHYYRLPTEAEWEYACRAGKSTAYSFGDDPKKLGDYAWYSENSDEKYHKVGLKKPNPWGLYDMHGNVAEWCVDEYVADRYKQLAAHAVENPLVMVTKMYPQVVRGGAWTDEAPLARSAARRGSSKEWKQQDPQIPQSIWYHTDADFVGFRVVRPLRVPSPEEAARYEVTEYEKQEFLDYKKAQAGKQ
jgi:formylglycine-generating enzyme required for sulfatase activity